jgi:3-deoxy-D-manno-octulosonic-acid transferase
MKIQPPDIGYRLISRLLIPVWYAHALWHGRKHGLKSYFRLRCHGLTGRRDTPQIWVHASSVGEIESITPLVDKLLKAGNAVLLTSFTATGYKVIQRNFGDKVQAAIIPVELARNCRRFLNQHSIKLCLLMETELWPEILFQTSLREIPIIQVNARLSNKSLNAPTWLRSVLRRSLGYITLILARNDGDRQNLLQLGADQAKIKVVGNLKSSINLESSYPNLIERPYLLIASSHETEEAGILAQRRFIDPLLIVIAPRHPVRSKSIQQELAQMGISFATRSQSQEINTQTEVYLADTLGELRALMAHATIVIMGGSFDSTGGHNLIEPAALGCTIITGPSDKNIREDITLLGDAIIQVSDVETCWQSVTQLLANPDRARVLGIQARKSVQSQSQILGNYLSEIGPYL